MIHVDNPLFTLLSKFIPNSTIPKIAFHKTMHNTVVANTDSHPLSLTIPIQSYKSLSIIVEYEQSIEVKPEYQ